VKTTRTKEIDGNFVEPLKRLRPDPNLLAEFPAVLNQEWEERTGDTPPWFGS
jgi:hypothetical protein